MTDNYQTHHDVEMAAPVAVVAPGPRTDSAHNAHDAEPARKTGWFGKGRNGGGVVAGPVPEQYAASPAEPVQQQVRGFRG